MNKILLGVFIALFGANISAGGFVLSDIGTPSNYQLVLSLMKRYNAAGTTSSNQSSVLSIISEQVDKNNRNVPIIESVLSDLGHINMNVIINQGIDAKLEEIGRILYTMQQGVKLKISEEEQKRLNRELKARELELAAALEAVKIEGSSAVEPEETSYNWLNTVFGVG